MRVTVWADSPRSVCLICLRKGEYRRITGCQSNFSAERTELFGTSLQSIAFPKKSLGLWATLVICIFFGGKNLTFYKLYIDEEHLHQIYFLFQTSYSAFIQLLPVLVIVIISVITQLLATNPPYSLFYKS